MNEPISTTVGALKLLKMMLVVSIPFVEPQIAGLFGAGAYMIVRHELSLPKPNFLNLMILGFLGAWITNKYLAGHLDLAYTDIKIISGISGFFAYDMFMILGHNSRSLIGFFINIIKTLIEKGMNK